jgi:hypothetical protein
VRLHCRQSPNGPVSALAVDDPLLPARLAWSWPDLLRHTFAVDVWPVPGVEAACAWWPPSRTPLSMRREHTMRAELLR